MGGDDDEPPLHIEVTVTRWAVVLLDTLGYVADEAGRVCWTTDREEADRMASSLLGHVVDADELVRVVNEAVEKEGDYGPALLDTLVKQ